MMRLNSTFQFPEGWQWLNYVLGLWALTGFALAGSVCITLIFHKDFESGKFDSYIARQKMGYFFARPEYARLRRRLFIGFGMFVGDIALCGVLIIFFGH